MNITPRAPSLLGSTLGRLDWAASLDGGGGFSLRPFCIKASLKQTYNICIYTMNYNAMDMNFETINSLRILAETVYVQ